MHVMHPSVNRFLREKPTWPTTPRSDVDYVTPEHRSPLSTPLPPLSRDKQRRSDVTLSRHSTPSIIQRYLFRNPQLPASSFFAMTTELDAAQTYPPPPPRHNGNKGRS